MHSRWPQRAAVQSSTPSSASALAVLLPAADAYANSGFCRICRHVLGCLLKLVVMLLATPADTTLEYYPTQQQWQIIPAYHLDVPRLHQA